MRLATSHNYEQILLQTSGLLDVRAPIEFKQGAFPSAANFPLLNDDERRRVGICYKQHGQQKAIEIGNQLVSGRLKQQRIERWVKYAKQQSQTYLYCFRGGLRSKISQQWLHEAGIETTRVAGGYKALRKYLIDQINQAPTHFDFILLGGLTGCRKTELVKSLPNGIDLEGAAFHRGSSFGAHALPQTSQINFENRVAIDLLKARLARHKSLTLEDEGRFIGSVDIPKTIFSQMRSAPLVIIEQPLEQRLKQLLQEYIVEMAQEFGALYGENEELAFSEFSDYLLNSLLRIRKRLGGARWKELQRNMQHALQTHKTSGSTDAHIQWLKPLLTQYYDPMYTSQIKNRSEMIVFHGDYSACRQFLREFASKSLV